MPRPQKERIVSVPPVFSSFKPTGVQRHKLNLVIMSLDEYEAIRLADFLKHDHESAAELMGISRPTFTRLIDSARAKSARHFVEGAELRIEGGNIHFKGNIYKCRNCGHIFRKELSENEQECPECSSRELTDIAESFGHGKCCREFNS